MSSNWITYGSKYLKDIAVSTDAERQTLAVLISAAQEFIEQYCARTFLQDSFDETIVAGGDGCIVLPNPPIASIRRLDYSSGGYLTISNETAEIATYSTTQESIKLHTQTSGVEANTTLLYATYPTLTLLSAAIDALTNWGASVETGYGSYPSTDLVANQYGDCTSDVVPDYWTGYTDHFDFNPDTGILSHFPRYERIRCQYTGGYEDCPEPIKLVLSNLVKQSYNGAQAKSVTLGTYSYTLDTVDQLAMADKKILGMYRDRGV